MISWIPRLSLQVWLMFLGRLLSQMGTGFTLFSAPIFFVTQVGFSATQVGLGLGSMAISGVVGRIAGGSLADTVWGRKRTLLLALGISALGSLLFATTHTFKWFVLANLVAGLGQGLYWPATESMVADMTTREQRNEAFGLNRLGDNLGLSLGAALAGLLVAVSGAYRLLFLIDAASFLLFAGIVALLIQESRPAHLDSAGMLAGWHSAFRDRSLLVFCLANILFTTYIAQISSSLPLYFTNVLELPLIWISNLFALHGILIAVLQLPVVRWLNRMTRIQGLQASALAWLVGFGLIWMTGVAPDLALGLSFLALLGMSLAIVLYNPSAASLVVDLAPIELRGVYLSVNSLCWAVGFGIGPAIGGIMLDLPPRLASYLWLGWFLSVGVVFGILAYLVRILPAKVNAGAAQRP